VVIVGDAHVAAHASDERGTKRHRPTLRDPMKIG
jgi:hypothetical protein